MIQANCLQLLPLHYILGVFNNVISHFLNTRISKRFKKWMKSTLTCDMSSEYIVTTQVSVFKYMIVRHQ